MKIIFSIVFCILAYLVQGQTSSPEKQITSYTQVWYSINSQFRFSNRWGMVADFHVRRGEFMKNDYFYFIRAGATYWIADKYPVIAGVAHLWLAPPAGNVTWSNENRIYQQWSAVQLQGAVSILHRIRVEERWRDRIVNDEVVGGKQYNTRLRYLASFDIKVFKDSKKPKLVVSDEILVQFGKDIVYNTFDQNRLFLGVKVPLSQKLSFDVGYMNILQQKSSGYQYDLSNVFRLFFYYNVDFTKAIQENIHDENSE